MCDTPRPAELSDLEFYRMIRARLEHEDGLVVTLPGIAS